VLVNTQGFYDRLIDLFEHYYREQFARPDYRRLYHAAPDVASVFSYLDSYRPVKLQGKWF